MQSPVSLSERESKSSPYCGTCGRLSLFLYLDKSSCGFLLFEVEKAVLDKLERREEDGVDGARSGHGHSEATIHVPLEELDLWSRLHLLAPGVHERILLVYALRRVDWICSIRLEGALELGGRNSQIMAQDTIPQRPPDMRTASLLAIG
jgi:hypothetical protein